jgi:DNA replication and repair protein RecF
LSEFRNYHTLSWLPAPRLNIVTGPNAQGKTNLLEALGLLVTGRSFRTSRLAEIPRWGVDSTGLSGELVRGDTRRTVRRVLARLEDGT